MLKLLRQKHVMKILLGGLIILILPAFVWWGAGNPSGSKEKGPRYVGIISGKNVSFADFIESLTTTRTLIILNYSSQPKILDSFLTNKPLMGKLAWDRLVMIREAKNYKINVSNKEVVDFMRSHSLFSREGKFDDKLYTQILRYSLGLEPRTFEEIIRKNIMVSKLHEAVTKNAVITDEEAFNEYKMNEGKFKISYILIEAKNFTDRVDISDERIKGYYEAHKNEFVLPVKDGEGAKLANLDDVKESIRSYLEEEGSKKLVFEYSEGLYKNILDMTAIGKKSFEDAVLEAGFQVAEAGPFSYSDYLEGLGEANNLAYIASTMKLFQIAGPVMMRNGALIFRLDAVEGIDEEKFVEEKSKFSEKALEKKKEIIFDNWFIKNSYKNKINIDFNDYEKYYR